MNNLIAFLNAFLSYFLVYIISVTTVVIAVLLGIRLRKMKDAKEAVKTIAEADSQ